MTSATGTGSSLGLDSNKSEEEMAKDYTATLTIYVAFTAKNEDQAEERLEKIEECVLDPRVKSPPWLGEVEQAETTIEEN